MVVVGAVQAHSSAASTAHAAPARPRRPRAKKASTGLAWGWPVVRCMPVTAAAPSAQDEHLLRLLLLLLLRHGLATMQGHRHGHG